MNNDFFERFLLFEEKEKLFDIEYNGFKIWEIMRGYIYIEIDMIYNKLQPLFPQQEKKKRIKKISFNTIINSFKIFFIKNIDYIFLNNPRRVKQSDGKYYCIYTDLLIDLLKEKNKCVTFEDPYWSLSPTSNISHFEPIKTDCICYLDSIEYIYNIKKFLFKKIYRKKYMELFLILSNIKVKVEKEFNCNLSNIYKMIEDKILYLILTYNIYKKCIIKAKPKAIFEFYDIFPSKIVVNKIAKELKIPIIEIQHGIVTKKNPIFLKYSSTIRKYDCLPDYVFSYGKKLLNTEYMPIKKENIFYIGSLFLNKKKLEYKKLKTNKKNILFISQSNIGKYLSKCAGELAELLKNNNEYQIIYKMHPYEIGVQYDCLNKNNIIVIDNRDKDLYYYHSISVAQVGVYSTGLYEGLNFGLNTFIMSDCYGFNEIKEIVNESNTVFYTKDANQIYDVLINKQIKNNNKNNYWHKVQYDKILEKIYLVTTNNKN